MNKKTEKEIFDNYIKFQYEYSDNLKSPDDIIKKLSKDYYYMNKNYSKFLQHKKRILEIGPGYGRFAYLCKQNKLNKYVGVDISKEEIKLLKKLFSNYTFILKDIFIFLKDSKEKYDLIFMSHVLEHFTIKEQIKLLKLIKKNLIHSGLFINCMPNASAYFGAISSRYIDITHKVLHNEKSFTQLLKLCGFNDINHYNMFIGRNIFASMLHKLFINIFNIIVKILGYDIQKIYTASIISVVSNKNKQK